VTGSPITTNSDPDTLELQLVRVDLDTFSGWGERWRALEQRAPDTSAYATFDWLHAWASVYQPRKLLLAHAVKTDDRTTAALGLIDVDRIRGWRFAGGAISPQRAPLCAPGCEAEVWRLLAAWLRRHRNMWSSLEASGIGEQAACVPGARLFAAPVPCLSVPGDFDAYLASMTGRQRKEVRRRLRRTEEASIEVREVSVDAFASAFADFLRMSELRPEIRKNHDRALGRMVERVATRSEIEVHLFEVIENEVRIGVSIDLIHNEVYYPYCLAWEPDRSAVAPGILLALNTIAFSIDRGLRVVNLGPGEQAYKQSLGFVAQEGLKLEAGNPASAGRALRILGDAYQRVRPRPTAISR
jgi:CelD/BcsL family acetyltransferase involved in cellulose biosynthesis